MWVICAGMPRSASTWQYQIASAIVERHLGGKRCGQADFHLLNEAQDMVADGRPRTFKTHLSNSGFKAVIDAGRSRHLYSYRDLRDVAVSLTHQWKTTLDDLLGNNTFNWLIEADRFWKVQPRTLIQRYETMVGDPPAAVKQIGLHIGASLDDRQVIELSDEFSIAKNSQRCQAFAESLAERGANLESSASTALKDQATQLHWNHIHSGRSGQWTELPEPQLRRLDGLCGEWLRENGYGVEGPVSA